MFLILLTIMEHFNASNKREKNELAFLHMIYSKTRLEFEGILRGIHFEINEIKTLCSLSVRSFYILTFTFNTFISIISVHIRNKIQLKKKIRHINLYLFTYPVRP